MASSSSSSSPTSQASLVILSNSWNVVAFLGLPGVAGGGLLPALIRLEQQKGDMIILTELRETINERDEERSAILKM